MLLYQTRSLSPQDVILSGMLCQTPERIHQPFPKQYSNVSNNKEVFMILTKAHTREGHRRLLETLQDDLAEQEAALNHDWDDNRDLEEDHIIESSTVAIECGGSPDRAERQEWNHSLRAGHLIPNAPSHSVQLEPDLSIHNGKFTTQLCFTIYICVHQTQL